MSVLLSESDVILVKQIIDLTEGECRSVEEIKFSVELLGMHAGWFDASLAANSVNGRNLPVSEGCLELFAAIVVEQKAKRIVDLVGKLR